VAEQWHDRILKPAPRLSNERLADIQARLGVRLPEDYLEVVRVHQGGSPEGGSVILPDGTGTPFNMLLHFEEQPEGLDVLGIVEWSEFLPDKVIPFAVDPGGNYFCFDYRASDTNPPVVFLAHDDPDTQPERVAGSFTELIDSLQD
jgi:cell wall assembly regulator SMI1